VSIEKGEAHASTMRSTQYAVNAYTLTRPER
jgi:hypothetical protein